MSNKETGGSAFPILGLTQNQSTGETLIHQFNEAGLTLRDYFAINADIGNVDELSMALGERLLSRQCPSFNDDAVGLLLWWAEYRAKLRYIEADAMLEARKS